MGLLVRSLRLAAVVAFSVLALSLAPAPATAQSSAPAPGVPDWVEASYEISFTSLERMELDAIVSIHQILMDGERVSADEIRQGRQIIGAKVEDKISSTFSAALARAFPDAASLTVTESGFVESTLTAAADGSEFTPTVDVKLAAIIVQSRESLGLAELGDEAAEAAFDAGAVFHTNFTVTADGGYDVTYRITPPPGLAWGAPSSGAVVDAALLVGLDNSRNAADASERVATSLYDPSATEPASEDIRTHVDLTLPTLTLVGSALTVEAEIEAAVHAVSVADRFPDALPAAVKLNHLSSDALRALKAAGTIDDADLDSASAQLETTVREALATSLGEGASISGGFVDATLAGGASAPFTDEEPVVYRATATGSHALPDLPPEVQGKNIVGIFQAGAAIAVDVTLSSEADRLTTFTLTVPSEVELKDATAGGQVSADGHSVTWTVDNRGGAARMDLPVSVRLHDAQAKTYDKQEATIRVVVDLKDIDISIAKAAGGDFGNILIDVNVAGNLAVVKIPDDLKAKLPPSAQLDYLSSDGIRILKRDGIIDDSLFEDLERDLLEKAKSQIAGALGTDAALEGGIDDASINAAIGTGAPIVINAKLSASKPLAGGAPAPETQAAMSLYTAPPLEFDLPKVEGLDTTYRIILPKGITIVDYAADRGDIAAGEENGREYFDVTPTSEEPAHTTVAMGVTPGFVVAKFWPVLLAALVLIVLLIAGPIVGVVMVRRRRRAKGGDGGN